MRGITPLERSTLLALAAPGEGTFCGDTLDALEDMRRAERYDLAPDGSYLMRVTELGWLALRLPPMDHF